MPELTTILLYLATGAAAGFAAGLLGVGGGLIIVPVLFFVLSAQGMEASLVMPMALATSLATIVITAMSSTLAHHRRGAVLWPVFMLLTPGILLGAASGGLFATSIDSRSLKSIFAVFELLVALHLLLKKPQAETPGHASHSAIHSDSHPLSPVGGIVGGTVIGFISSLVGIGGGTLTVPFLHIFGVPMKKAVATSAACGLPIALAGSLAFVAASYQLPTGSGNLGYLNLPALLLISLGSFSFAPLGARVAHAISEKALRLNFAGLLCVLGISMLFS